MHSKPVQFRRGSALLSVMMVVAMLMAVVLGMQYFEANRRQSMLYDEAQLEFRQGYRFKLQETLLTGMPAPSTEVWASRSSLDKDADKAAQEAALNSTYASKLFDRTLPNLRTFDAASVGSNWYDFTPKSSNLSMMVFRKNSFRTVINSVPGYAAFAPKGKVDVDELKGWSNPDFSDKRDALKAYSGLPAVVAAMNNVHIGTALYAEAHTTKGSVTIDKGEGAAFKAALFPSIDYSQQVWNELIAARDALKANAANGDKSRLLIAGDGIFPDTIVKMLFDGEQGIEQMFSLQNANSFWLPIIPSISTAPPYLYTVTLHVPDVPDTVVPDNYKSATGEKSDAIKNKTKLELEPANADLKTKQAAYDNASSSDKDAKKKELDDAQKKVDTINGELKTLNDQFKQVSQEEANNLKTMMGSARGVPRIRKDDDELKNGKGRTGWDMKVAFDAVGKLFGMIPELFAGNARALYSIFSNTDVKLIHFGGKERPFDNFKFPKTGGPTVIDATMNVPRGRTLTLRSNSTLEIKGNLWLQRGSTFVADCDTLLISRGHDGKGGVSGDGFFDPSGRIFMEEGSTLICRGKLQCAGSPRWGSVIVGGVPSKIHPITAGIFAQNVVLDNGVFAGCALDDLVEGIGGNSLSGLNDHFLRPLLSVIAPNAAKVLGPVHARKPYFASYATTILIFFFPTPPFGIPSPVPIITPVPMPTKNLHIAISKVFALLYQVNLNLGIGENFYTHSDWWIFGEGQVAMVPQVDPEIVKDSFNSLVDAAGAALDGLDPEKLLGDLSTKVVLNLTTSALTGVLQPAITKLMASAIPYAGLVVAAAVDAILEPAMDALFNRDDLLSSISGSFTDGFSGKGSGAQGLLSNLTGKFTTETGMENAFMRQYNGLLVQADNTMTIGGKYASGMFVAGDALTINATQCIGTLMSLRGDVKCKNLLFYPFFNRASFYKPNPLESDMYLRAFHWQYDSHNDTHEAINAGPPKVTGKVTAEGWNL